MKSRGWNLQGEMVSAEGGEQCVNMCRSGMYMTERGKPGDRKESEPDLMGRGKNNTLKNNEHTT